MAEATTLSPVGNEEISKMYDQLQEEADKHHIRFEVYLSKLAGMLKSEKPIFVSSTKSASGPPPNGRTFCDKLSIFSHF